MTDGSKMWGCIGKILVDYLRLTKDTTNGDAHVTRESLLLIKLGVPLVAHHDSLQ